MKRAILRFFDNILYIFLKRCLRFSALMTIFILFSGLVQKKTLKTLFYYEFMPKLVEIMLYFRLFDEIFLIFLKYSLRFGAFMTTFICLFYCKKKNDPVLL